MVPNDSRVLSSAWVNFYKHLIDGATTSAKTTFPGKALDAGGSLQQTSRAIYSIGNILASSKDAPETDSNVSPALKIDHAAGKLSASMNLSSKRFSKALITSRQYNVEKARAIFALLKEDGEEDE